MMALLKNILQPGHDDVVDAVAQTLADRHWQVDREPIVGGNRPDLVAHQPGGPTYVFEIKAGRPEANLGAVAQVEAYLNAWPRDPDQLVKGVLVVGADAPAELDSIADDAGVELVRISGGLRSLDLSLESAGVVGGQQTASDGVTPSPSSLRPAG